MSSGQPGMMGQGQQLPPQGYGRKHLGPWATGASEGTPWIPSSPPPGGIEAWQPGGPLPGLPGAPPVWGPPPYEVLPPYLQPAPITQPPFGIEPWAPPGQPAIPGPGWPEPEGPGPGNPGPPPAQHQPPPGYGIAPPGPSPIVPPRPIVLGQYYNTPNNDPTQMRNRVRGGLLSGDSSNSGR